MIAVAASESVCDVLISGLRDALVYVVMINTNEVAPFPSSGAEFSVCWKRVSY